MGDRPGLSGVALGDEEGDSGRLGGGPPGLERRGAG